MKLNVGERVGEFFGTYLLTSSIVKQWPFPDGTGTRVDLKQEGPLNMNIPPTDDLIGKRMLFKKVKDNEYTLVRVG